MNVYPVLNHLLWIGFRHKDDDISSLKLQKMLYFLHGWYLAITGQALISEPFIKGDYGPIIPEVDKTLKMYKGLAVDDYIKQFDSNTLTYEPFFVDLKKLPQFESIAQKVWEQYHNLSLVQLSTLANCQGTPYDLTKDGEIIPNELIRDYFVKLGWQNEMAGKKLKI